MSTRLSTLCLAALLAALGSHAETGNSVLNAFDHQLAAEEATVLTTAGRTFHGRLDGFRAERLHIRLATDGGEVGYSFRPEEIERFTIPGDDLESLGTEALERGDIEQALPILTAVGRQRGRYLPLLDEQQRRPLLLAIRVTEKALDPLSTIGYAKLFEPYAETSIELATVRDALLNAHAKLGMTAETRRLAERWCAQTQIPPASALGWTILARLAYAEGDFERSRWIALQPVVFAGFNPTAHLDQAYAFAVAASHQLGDISGARALYSEMVGRDLSWPDEPSLGQVAQFYADGGGADANATASRVVDPPTIARPDKRLTLEDVRKLVVPSTP